jgi:dinuclear metal center YbgI/SA1388 family protein
MTVKELEGYFNELLRIEDSQRNDSSLNGLQIGERNGEVKKIAFAVDSGIEVFKRAAETGAQLLFAHHGLLWGKQFPITGVNYERFSYLIRANLSLYAAHLPLDLHPEYGNNAQLASFLGLKNLTPFGEYHGIKIGFKGELEKPQTIDQLENTVCGPTGGRKFPFGPKINSTVGIISGSAPREAEQAIREGIDCYITGETSHEIYHLCMEGKINVLFGGHYNTETAGVKAVCTKTQEDTGISTTFIDVPTGL